MPVHLVAAERDDITPARRRAALATLLPDADLAVLPGVGHLVHYETPREAAAEIAAVAHGCRLWVRG